MIEEFRGEYRWLSNFHLVNIHYQGIDYPSTEHAYQAAKTLELEDKIYISHSVKTPGEAKKIGMTLDLREDWDEIKLKVMEDITRLKFKNPELRQKLLDTGDQELVEGNTWNDVFWGVCRGVGQNHLGKILMRIRSEIKESGS